jgi:di/tricarboxylate transporter
MDASTTTYLVLAGAVVLFMSNRVHVALVALAVPLALWATDVLTLEQAFAGFGDPTVLFIAAMFVVADSLEATGVTAWIGQQLLARSGGGGPRVVALVMVVCALITAFITPNASVAALIPAVVIIALRVKLPTSQLLMPLAFGAHCGALLALTGSPVNVLVSEAGRDAGVGSFGFFSYALVGIPLLVGCVVITVLLGPRVLPRRNGRSMPPDFSSLAATLVNEYELEHDADSLFTRHHGVVEVVIPPRSPLIGQCAFRGMVTESGELIVVAVAREGEDVGPGEVELRAGDVLLLQGRWEAFERQLDGDVLAVDEPEAIRRQLVVLGAGAKQSLLVLAGMVLLLVTGAVPPAVAALLAASALVVLRISTMEHAYRAISWTTVILVAGMIPLSTAMQSSGAAQEIADGLVEVVGDAGPYALLVALFGLVAFLGQLISNTATALVVIPVALSAAVELDVSARPVLMVVNIAAAAALLTPIATPANMMVMEPGGYRFGDYWKLGLPLMVWFFAVAVVITPLIWRF